MEVESLRRKLTQLKTEKAALNVKSKLFEGFAAMANTCCRLPSSAEWDSLKTTLKKDLRVFHGADRGREQQSGFTR